MSLPSAQSRVICCGLDLQLLRTRTQVLTRTYDAVEVSSVAELEALPAEPPFQLVLFCHTLSLDQSEAFAATAQRRWPQAKIMALTSGVSGAPYEQADAFVTSAQGPAVLLKAIDLLIRRTALLPVTLLG